MNPAEPFTIRRYRPADWDAVLKLNAYGLAAAGIQNDFYQGEDFSELESTYGEATRGVLLVGEVADQVVAMAGLRQLDEDTCEVLRMRVFPDYQGCGYGRKILSRLEEEARRLGYARAHLLTGEDQHPAVDLYTSHDYQVSSREVLLGIPSVHMVKELCSRRH